MDAFRIADMLSNNKYKQKMSIFLLENMFYSRVDSQEWDFVDSNKDEHVHGIHNYPAMMIPPIPRKVLNDFGNGSKVVFDPFMGSGTVLVESVLKNEVSKVYGVDINPLALLLAKVKTTPLDKEVLEKEFSKLKTKIMSKSLDYEYKSKLKNPDYFNLEFWFKPNVIKDLLIIKNCIQETKNNDFRDFFKICFSETVRKASNTRGGEFKLYRIPEEKLAKHNPNTIAIFLDIAGKNVKRMVEFRNRIFHGKNVSILYEDTREKTSIPEKSVDIVITSPPYGDSRTTVAYGQFSRLSLQWLDFDYDLIKEIDKRCLGGKKISEEKLSEVNSETFKEVYSKIKKIDSKRALDVLSFIYDFQLCVKEIDRLLTKNGVVCMVVGNRTVKGNWIEFDKILTEMFAKLNYKFVNTFMRKISNKRMPLANSPSNIKGETISTMNNEFIVVLKKN